MSTAFERELRSAQWPRSFSELQRAGVSWAALRGRSWRTTSRGFYVPAEVAISTTQRIFDVAPLVPRSGAIGGWAAGYVLGVNGLDGRSAETLELLPVPVLLGQDLGRADTLHVQYVRDRLPEMHRQRCHGLKVTSVFRTAFDGACWAPTVTEAVVFLDQIAHELDLDLAELSAWCSTMAGYPGVQRVRVALALADAASASPPESRVRVFYVCQAGLPRPSVNTPIFDLEGRLLGIADLFDPEAGLVTEVDGQEHRRRRQHRADNLREEDLEAVNLVVCRVDTLDLRFRRALSDRLRARHAQAMARDRRRDAWTIEPPLWWRRRRAARTRGSLWR